MGTIVKDNLYSIVYIIQGSDTRVHTQKTPAGFLGTPA